MAIAPQLQIRQSQSLVMTPQLQQAIKLLQLSNIELSSYVEQELERNPLLERPENDGPAATGEVNGVETNGHDMNGVEQAGGAMETLKLDGDSPSEAASSSIDADVDNTFNNDSAADAPPDAAQGLGLNNQQGASRGAGSQFDDGDYNLENTLSGEKTLREHLLDQLHAETGDPVQRFIGAQLIELVDDAGYLREPVAELALRLGTDEDAIEGALIMLQGFDPIGVGARDLAECLTLQLRERNRLDPAMEALLANLELVAKRDMAGLARICGVDNDDVMDMLAELRTLNPKPGFAFDHEIAQTLIPDVFVRKMPDGTWHVELNSDTLPRVLVNSRYHAKVSASTKDKADKVYLSDCLSSANWLVKSLDQRANTILKVASEIVRQQDAFLEQGVQYLKPLNLRAIAEAIGMHESTVSRVTANKYIATPRGIFEMKYFFTASIASSDGGEAHSAEAVRQRIRELIEKETANTVLSDDKLVEILMKSGIDIARRTVAKYREALRIPSSVQRRRMLLAEQPAA